MTASSKTLSPKHKLWEQALFAAWLTWRGSRKYLDLSADPSRSATLAAHTFVKLSRVVLEHERRKIAGHVLSPRKAKQCATSRQGLVLLAQVWELLPIRFDALEGGGSSGASWRHARWVDAEDLGPLKKQKAPGDHNGCQGLA